MPQLIGVAILLVLAAVFLWPILVWAFTTIVGVITFVLGKIVLVALAVIAFLVLGFFVG